jgi:hypothetical protein
MALRRRRARAGSTAVPFIGARRDASMLRNKGRWAPGRLEVRAAASAGVPGREASGGPAGRRLGRPGDERKRGAWQGVSRGCGARTRVTGPPRRPGTAVRRQRRVAALWSAGRGGERDVACSSKNRCGASYFDQVFLPKFELKHTEQETAKPRCSVEAPGSWWALTL